jgi:hypothetical protein
VPVSGLPQALGLDLIEATTVPVERGGLFCELLPPAYDEVHVFGLNLEATANSLRQFCGQERTPGSQERVIDCLPTFGVIQDGAAHELDRLLGSMARRRFFLVLAAERIQR